MGWLPSRPLRRRAGGQPSASCSHSLCPRGAQCSHRRSAGGPANTQAQKLGARGAATKPSATLQEDSLPSGEALAGGRCGAVCVCVCVCVEGVWRGCWTSLPCWPAGRGSRDFKFPQGPGDPAGPGCSSRGSLGPCTSAWHSPRPGRGLADPAGVAHPALNCWAGRLPRATHQQVSPGARLRGPGGARTHGDWCSCSCLGCPLAAATESGSHTGLSCAQATLGSRSGPGCPWTSTTRRGALGP